MSLPVFATGHAVRNGANPPNSVAAKLSATGQCDGRRGVMRMMSARIRLRDDERARAECDRRANKASW